jgi:hypothetical protein
MMNTVMAEDSTINFGEKIETKAIRKNVKRSRSKNLARNRTMGLPAG